MATDDIERQLLERLERLPPDCRERVLEHRGKMPLQALIELADCLGASTPKRRSWWNW